MLTPVDIQNKSFKGGIGFDKRDVEQFMNEVQADYSLLYRSNVELKDKVNTLNESLQHYKSIEDSMQKALTLSEKTSEETINAAGDKARQITTEAEFKAESLLENARKELEELKNEIYRLTQQRDQFKAQFADILNSELKMLDGEIVDIDLGDFNPSGSTPSNNSEGGLGGMEGGLGGMEGGLGGAYAGASTSNFERTNQSPAFDRGALNTDPFAEAANGGGRFSKQTGGRYTNSDKSTKKESGKTSLNIKTSNSSTPKVKRGVPIRSVDEPKSDLTLETKPVPESVPTPQPVPAPEPVSPAPQPVPTPEPVSPAPQPVPTPEPVRPTPQPVPTPEPVKTAPQPIKPTIKTDDDFKVTQEQADSKAMDEFNATVANIKAAMMKSEQKENEDSRPIVGEVEPKKIKESNMIDSADNHLDEGFNFFDDNDEDVTTMTFDYSNKNDIKSSIQTGGFNLNNNNDDDETLHGEVETRVKESNMIDSADNHTGGFDFIVGNDSEELEIPTIINKF
jgi:cell division initiation protein